MRRTKIALLAFSALSLGGSQLACADAGLPTDNWTGTYAGIHMGGTWGSTGAFDLDGYNVPPGGGSFEQSGPPLPPGDRWHADTAGFVVGGQLGYNWQIGALLLGLEGDVGQLGLTGQAATNAPFAARDTSSRTEIDLYLTARGRIGYVAGNWLFYGTGGYFGADTRVEIVDTCFVFPPCGRSTIDARNRSFRSGWTAGGGIEWMFSQAWTAKAEYLYYDLGSTTTSGLAAGVGPTFSWDVNTHGNIARAAVNYRFNWFDH